MALPAIAGGAGGVDLSAGPSAAGGEATGAAGGQVFTFAPPQSVQVANSMRWPLIIGAAVAGLWLLKRK